MQLPTEKGQKDKQRSAKHYTGNKILSNMNTNPTTIGVKFRCSGGKKTYNDLQNITQITRTTRTPLKPEVNLGAPEG